MWIIRLCFCAAMCLANTHALPRGTSQEHLRFRKAGDFVKFKILIFGDLHYGEGAPLDQKSSDFQEHLLQLEAPVDLVVVNGDMSSNYKAPWFCNSANHRAVEIVRKMCKQWWIEKWAEYTAPLIKHQVPYALNLGNHDALEAFDATGREILEHDRSANYPLSFTQLGPENVSRASNYFIPIYPPTVSDSNATSTLDTDDETVAGIWMLDSGATTCMGAAGWGCVLPDQIAWFREEAKRQGGVPSHMFVHIPVEEALHIWNRKRMSVPGRDRGHVLGSALDAVDCSALNTGLFAAISDPASGVRGLWHGHDHNNDFFGTWAPSAGPAVGYGRKSGYGGVQYVRTRYTRFIRMRLNPRSLPGRTSG